MNLVPLLLADLVGPESSLLAEVLLLSQRHL